MNIINYNNLPTTAVTGTVLPVANDWSKNGYTNFQWDGYNWLIVPGQTILEIDYNLKTYMLQLTTYKTFGQLIQQETGSLTPDWIADPKHKLNVKIVSSYQVSGVDQIGSYVVTGGGVTDSLGTTASPTGTSYLWSIKIYS